MADTTVNCGGGGGSGSYTVGVLFLSDLLCLIGRLFLWCLVLLNCGVVAATTTSAPFRDLGVAPTARRTPAARRVVARKPIDPTIPASFPPSRSQARSATQRAGHTHTPRRRPVFVGEASDCSFSLIRFRFWLEAKEGEDGRGEEGGADAETTTWRPRVRCWLYEHCVECADRDHSQRMRSSFAGEAGMRRRARRVASHAAACVSGARRRHSSSPSRVPRRLRPSHRRRARPSQTPWASEAWPCCLPRPGGS